MCATNTNDLSTLYRSWTSWLTWISVLHSTYILDIRIVYLTSLSVQKLPTHQPAIAGSRWIGKPRWCLQTLPVKQLKLNRSNANDSQRTCKDYIPLYVSNDVAKWARLPSPEGRETLNRNSIERRKAWGQLDWPHCCHGRKTYWASHQGVLVALVGPLQALRQTILFVPVPLIWTPFSLLSPPFSLHIPLSASPRVHV